MTIQTYYDVLQLLKRFGVFIYTGDRPTDIALVRSEVKDMFELGVLSKEDYIEALLALSKEEQKN